MAARAQRNLWRSSAGENDILERHRGTVTEHIEIIMARSVQNYASEKR